MKLSNTKILLILLFIQLSMVKSQTSEEFSGGESNPRFFPYPEWLFQGFPLNLSKVVTTELPTGLPTGLLTGQPTELSTGESSGLSTEESSRLPTGQPLAPIKSISANAQCSCKDTNELKGSLRHQQGNFLYSLTILSSYQCFYCFIIRLFKVFTACLNYQIKK